MKRFGFVAVAGALALAACNSRTEETVGNVEDNLSQAEQLNLADNAADAATAESDTLANQAEQLNQESPAASDNNLNTTEDENVAGM